MDKRRTALNPKSKFLDRLPFLMEKLTGFAKVVPGSRINISGKMQHSPVPI